MFNLVGLPAGLTDNGLPVGMQIVSPPFETEPMVVASEAYERVNPWQDNYTQSGQEEVHE